MTCKGCIYYEACSHFMTSKDEVIAMNYGNSEEWKCFKDKSRYVEVRKGKWIKNNDSIGWHCSYCKKDDVYAYLMNYDGQPEELQDYFCPNCGADMRGATNDL